MAEKKPPNINAILSETIEHIVAIEAENFYFRQALSLARTNPDYGLTAELFEKCLSVVQAAPEQFDYSAARTRCENFRQIVDRLLPPDPLQSV